MVYHFLTSTDIKFKLETVVCGPGMLHYFGFSIAQHEKLTCTFVGEDEPRTLELAILARLRTKDVDGNLIVLERSMFASLNASFSWLDTIVSPFCAAASSRLRQVLPVAYESDLAKQRAFIGEHKRLRSVLSFGRQLCGNQEY